MTGDIERTQHFWDKCTSEIDELASSLAIYYGYNNA
jgi:hypothetical protein